MTRHLNPKLRLVVTQPYTQYRHVCTLADMLWDNDVEEMLPLLTALESGHRSALIGGGTAPLFMVEVL